MENNEDKSFNKTYSRQTVASMLVLAVVISGLLGTALYEHKQEKDHFNVVLENKDKKLLVEDVKTKDQRILDWRFATYMLEHLKYLQFGDTVNVIMKENKYNNHKVLSVDGSILKFNEDSVHARQQREIFDVKRREMMSQR